MGSRRTRGDIHSVREEQKKFNNHYIIRIEDEDERPREKQLNFNEVRW